MVTHSTEHRSLRSASQAPITSDDIRRVAFKKNELFLGHLVIKLSEYFLPWPVWLCHAERSLLFTATPNNDEPEEFNERLAVRVQGFKDLVENTTLLHDLQEDEIPVLVEQYTTLCIIGLEMDEAISNADRFHSLKHINNKIWYDIGTTEVHYADLKRVIEYCLKVLVRDYNECTVESVIGDIAFVKGGKESRRSRIGYKTHQRQQFVRENGPDPLLSYDVRIEALNRQFQNQRVWNFLKSIRLGNIPSSTFSTLLQLAKANHFDY